MFLHILRREGAAIPGLEARALEGLRAYQQAHRPAPRTPAPAIATAGRATLRDYGGAGAPAVFVPSLINPPSILDLAEHNSLLRWLAGQGVRPLLVDWGAPSGPDRDLSLAGHVETLLLPLLETLGEPPLLVGYCLGGTMALAAAALRPPRGLALIAAPWRFAAYPPDARDRLAALWTNAAPFAERLGVLPMEALQAGFWELDPARTIAKFARFGELAPNGAEAGAFVALEDWANQGPPLTFAAARELMEDLFAADRPGAGRWQVGGRTIDPAALRCPVFDIVSTTDRLVPPESAAAVGERRELGQGHVGMIVGARAQESLWRPLAEWLKGTYVGG